MSPVGGSEQGGGSLELGRVENSGARASKGERKD